MTALERVTLVLACATLAALPFETDRLAVAIEGSRLTMPEALAGLTVVAALASLASVEVRRDFVRLGLFAPAALVFVFALGLAAVLAPENRGLSFKFVTRMAGGASFGFAIAFLVARRPRALGPLLAAYVGGVAVASVIGVAEFVAPAKVLAYLALFREQTIYTAGAVRAASTYGYPNTLATSIAMALPLVAAWRTGSAGGRCVRAVCVLVLAAALVATFSRGGLVAAAAGLVVFGAGAWMVGERAAVLRATAALATVAVVWLAAWLGAAQLARRATTGNDGTLLAAAVTPASRQVAAAPGATATMPVTVANTGALAWESTADAPFTLVARWYDTTGAEVVAEGDRTFLPEHVAPGQTITVDASYVAPPAEGEYWLVWDVYIEHRLRFGDLGMQRSAVRVSAWRDPNAAASRVRDIYTEPRVTTDAAGASYAQPSRLDLWRAALRMFRERPLTGIGPDNFRLSYGRYLGQQSWDRRVYANNIYLELLATAGVVGFGAFCVLVGLVLARAGVLVSRERTPACDRCLAIGVVAAFAVVLAHGVVDYFLEFTCGFIPFWTWAALVVACAATASGRPPNGEPS